MKVLLRLERNYAEINELHIQPHTKLVSPFFNISDSGASVIEFLRNVTVVDNEVNNCI